MIKNLIIPSPRVSENYKNFDKACMKLFPNLTRRHFITLTSHVLVYEISALFLHAQAEILFERKFQSMSFETRFFCLHVCLFVYFIVAFLSQLDTHLPQGSPPVFHSFLHLPPEFQLPCWRV